MNICFDMDGTIADFYGVENWLLYLEQSNPFPYRAAKPLMNFRLFARQLNILQRQGHKLVIVSWTSKNGTDEFNKQIAEEKKKWLRKHLPSVSWDAIYIVPYGTSKAKACGVNGKNWLLFDDEKRNREEWTAAKGLAFSQKEAPIFCAISTNKPYDFY